nr:protein m142 [Mastomys natalensis cytomegalovirus 3]WEG69958.1 protein m142 [Mastomys natalensis cytomegalovirus 3]WEG70098.1 protein m142 [Mastomys natalensis cytomegalovirus 3]WEG70238.1 protein m142 [Mastomys natalensis cytomegalovirus 3]WEG70378.1 protein m142 [Mastomys natalensis cytomegalovirus 3]
MDILCAAVRSDNFHDMRPIGMRPRYRYIISDAVSLTLHDFSSIFVVQNDPRAVDNLVREESGRILAIGGPSQWALCLRRKEEVESYPGQPSWSTYDGMPMGTYVLLGQIIRRTRPNSPCEELRWFMYLGPHGQLLCHVEKTNAVYVIALSIDELARRGLVNSEMIYTEHHMPRTTTSPVRLVNDICQIDPKDGKAISEFVKSREGRVILLHTPGEGDRPLALCGTEECMRQWWPFSKASDADMIKFSSRIARTLKCTTWHYFGCVGLKVGHDPFRVESVLIVDDFGAIFHVDPDTQSMWRVADDVDQLFKMGLAKVYVPRRRLDPGNVGRMRGEAPGCAHVADAAWGEGYSIYGVRAKHDYAAQLRWLLREDRFEEQSGTWDENDTTMRKTFDRETKESTRRDVELADSMNDISYTMKGQPHVNRVITP